MKLVRLLLVRRSQSPEEGDHVKDHREEQVRQIAQESEEVVRTAKQALRRPPALIELRRLDSRRPRGHSS